MQRHETCDSWRMRLPRWYLSIPHVLRWAADGAIVLAAVGVTLYVAMLGAIAGFVLGMIAGAVARLR